MAGQSQFSTTKATVTNYPKEKEAKIENRFARCLILDEDPEPPENIDKSDRFINEL